VATRPRGLGQCWCSVLCGGGVKPPSDSSLRPEPVGERPAGVGKRAECAGRGRRTPAALTRATPLAPRISARRGRRVLARLASAPWAVHDALGIVFSLITERKRWLIGAIAYWGCDIATLWTCFQAFGSPPTVAVIVMAYFVGTLANSLPLPGGLGVSKPAWSAPLSPLARTPASRSMRPLLPPHLFLAAHAPGRVSPIRRTVGVWRVDTKQRKPATSPAVGKLSQPGRTGGIRERTRGPVTPFRPVTGTAYGTNRINPTDYRDWDTARRAMADYITHRNGRDHDRRSPSSNANTESPRDAAMSSAWCDSLNLRASRGGPQSMTRHADAARPRRY
jgi:hypothetical protein